MLGRAVHLPFAVVSAAATDADMEVGFDNSGVIKKSIIPRQWACPKCDDLLLVTVMYVPEKLGQENPLFFVSHGGSLLTTLAS